MNVRANVCMRMLGHISVQYTAEICLLVFGVLVVAALAFVVPATSYQVFALPLLPWAAIRFGVRATCILMMALGAIATWSALSGIGEFPHGRFTRNTLLLVLSLNVTAMLLLLLAEFFTRRKKATSAQRDEIEARERHQQVSLLGQAVLMTQIFGPLAHELNQPLTAILVNAQAALRLLRGASAEANEFREILTDIVQEERRATEILRRLRALMLPKHASKQPVDLNEIVEEVLQLLKSELRSQRISVKTALDPMLCTVLADHVQIQQVLLSLVISGCASMSNNDPQKRELRLATRYVPKLRAIEISVADSCSGLPSEDIASLFESRLPAQHDGIGIGLISARSIVEAFGGRLWAEVRDEGTIVRFTLPLPEGAARHAAR